MSLKKDILACITDERFDDLDKLVAADARAVRYLLGLTYQADQTVRLRAARALALAAKHHSGLIENVIRRLVWAMNDESGANALSAPDVVVALADEVPELLVPVVPDLIRLSSDEGLKDRLHTALSVVVARCPGMLKQELTKSLNKELRRRGRGRA